MRLFISTGEVSGDLQGALLIEALKEQAKEKGLELEIFALGGEKMAAVGAKIVGDTTVIASMGLLETLPFLVPTIKVRQKAIACLKENPPDLVVLIDNMGLNIAVGQFIRRNYPKIPLIYYIAPQAWAANLRFLTATTTSQIVSVCDKLLAIFPEEARYFSRHGANVTWVGHPLVDRMQTFPTREQARSILNITEDDVAVALLPASRHQELKYLLPTIFKTAQNIQAQLPKVHFWIPLSLEVFRQPIEDAIQSYGLQATVISNHQQKQVLAAADLAITKCGTVNLELALLKVPQVVMYKLQGFSFWVAENIMKLSLPFACPANLVVMKPIVPEFIQNRASVENLTQAAMELLTDTQRRSQTIRDYQQMSLALGETGVCSRVAKEILGLMVMANG